MGKITCKAWDDDPDVTSDLLKGGYIRVRKTGKDAPLPQSGEDLRSRIKIWGISWICAASKHSTSPALQNLDPQLFYDYADFLLGPRVRDLQAKDSGGNFLSRPPISLVFSYEYSETRELHSPTLPFVATKIGQRRPLETREKQRQKQRQWNAANQNGEGEKLACRDARWEEDLLQFQQSFWLVIVVLFMCAEAALGTSLSSNVVGLRQTK